MSVPLDINIIGNISSRNTFCDLFSLVSGYVDILSLKLLGYTVIPMRDQRRMQVHQLVSLSESPIWPLVMFCALPRHGTAGNVQEVQVTVCHLRLNVRRSVRECAGVGRHSFTWVFMGYTG